VGLPLVDRLVEQIQGRGVFPDSLADQCGHEKPDEGTSRKMEKQGHAHESLLF
jgi:hypothetical protein